MKDLNIKIREVFLPFLLVAIGTILFYGIFRWLFDIELGILPLKEKLLTFWVPIALTIIVIIVFLRKRVRILNIRGERGNGYFVYQFAMAIAIVLPLCTSQDYLIRSAYDLKKVADISEIKNLKNEKYFKIENFKVDEYESSSYVTARVSGRHNEHLDFYLYFATPFQSAENIWYGVKYSIDIRNRSNESRKNRAYRSFIKVSRKQFNSYDFHDVNYFEKLGYSDDKDGFLNAIKENYPIKVSKEQIILIPHKKAFEERFKTSLPWIFGSLAIGCFIIFIMIVIPKIDKKELERYRQKKPLKEDDLKDLLVFLNLRGEYKGTAILILANMIVFLGMIFAGLNIISPTPQELLEIGGNRRPEVLHGEYWRLFTSTFIHAGLMHLLLNIFGIGLGGVSLEKILGPVKLVFIYIVCGILASLASIYWHENTVSVGASGAIFGLYGLLFAFLIFKIIPKYDRSHFWMLLGLFGGISLLLGIFSAGTDNAGHFGGLFSGFGIGMFLILLNKNGLKKNAR